MAKREMNSARLFREGREYMGCTAEQLKEFKRRFHSGSDGSIAASECVGVEVFIQLHSLFESRMTSELVALNKCDSCLAL